MDYYHRDAQIDERLHLAAKRKAAYERFYMGPFVFDNIDHEIINNYDARRPLAVCTGCNCNAYEVAAWWCERCNATIFRTGSQSLEQQKQLRLQIAELKKQVEKLKAENERLKSDAEFGDAKSTATVEV